MRSIDGTRITEVRDRALPLRRERAFEREKRVSGAAMLNQAVVEALYSATYIENYLDCVENLPNDLQRYVSRLRELDATCQSKFDRIFEAPPVARSFPRLFLGPTVQHLLFPRDSL